MKWRTCQGCSREMHACTCTIRDEDKAWLIETAILFDSIGDVPVNWALVREVDRRVLHNMPAGWFTYLQTDEAKAARAKGTLR